MTGLTVGSGSVDVERYRGSIVGEERTRGVLIDPPPLSQSRGHC